MQKTIWATRAARVGAGGDHHHKREGMVECTGKDSESVTTRHGGLRRGPGQWAEMEVLVSVVMIAQEGEDERWRAAVGQFRRGGEV